MNGDAVHETMTADELKREKLRLQVEGMRRQAPPWLKASQPFLLVMATAIVSGILVPDLSRRAQVSEKELEIKTALASGVGSAVAAFVNEIQSCEVDKVHSAGKHVDFKAANAAYREWMVEESVIAARIEAYFPQLAGEWRTYARAVEEVYALAGTIDSAYRRGRIDVLRTAMPEARIDWETLAADARQWESREQWRPYEKAWFGLREALFQARDEIVRKMLQSSTTLY